MRCSPPKTLVWLGCLILSLVTLQSHASNCPEMPVDGHLYSIINYGSGKALDVDSHSTDPAANIITWNYNNNTNQHFYLHNAGNGYWTIQAQHSGMNLDVLNFSTANGANIIQWHATGTNNQQWLLKQSSLGAFNVVSRNSSKSLTVAGGYPGANVYQNADTANTSQRWYFNPVDGSCGAQAGVSGFAAQPGNDGLTRTTGGGNARPVTVRSCGALVKALGSDSPAVVQIPDNTTINCHTANRVQPACPVKCPAYVDDPNKTFYRIPVGNQRCTELGSDSDATVNRTRNETTIWVHPDKTVVGLGPGATISGGSFYLADTNNVIIRNLTIENVNPGLIEAGDGITLANSSHIWLDHLSFRLISDGHVDIKNSQNVTLSWDKFDGYNPAVCGSQHNYTSLVQDSQVTYHHDFWDRVAGRNPKLTGPATRAHIYNNYWRNVSYFSVNASHGAQAKLEGDYFENSLRPHWNEGDGYIDANLTSNRYTGVSATDSYKDTGNQVFRDTPLYFYRVDDVNSVPAMLRRHAGPQ